MVWGAKHSDRQSGFHIKEKEAKANMIYSFLYPIIYLHVYAAIIWTCMAQNHYVVYEHTSIVVAIVCECLFFT